MYQEEVTLLKQARNKINKTIQSLEARAEADPTTDFPPEETPVIDSGDIMAPEEPVPDDNGFETGINEYGLQYTLIRGFRHRYSEQIPLSSDNQELLATDSDSTHLIHLPTGNVEYRPGIHFWIPGTSTIANRKGMEEAGINVYHNQSAQQPSIDGKQAIMWSDRVGLWDHNQNKLLFSEKLSHFGISSASKVNWVQVTPNGDGYVFLFNPSGTSPGQGAWLYDFNGSPVRQVCTSGKHSCIGLDQDDRPFYAVGEMYQPGLGETSIHRRYLDASEEGDALETNWSRNEHISATGGPGKPLVMWGNNAWPNNAHMQEMAGKIWLWDYVNNKTRILAAHKSLQSHINQDGSHGYNYWEQPQPAISWDGKRVVYATNLGTLGSINCVILELD